MREHALDLAKLGRVRQELLGHVEVQLPADDGLRLDQAIERRIDRAPGRVLDGDHTELGARALDLIEDVGNRAAWLVVRGRSEALARDLMRERRRRTEVRDGQRMLEIATARQHLAPDRGDRVPGKRTGRGRTESSEDLRLALRGIRRHPIPLFELSDPEGGLCTLVEEVEDLVVKVIDPGAPIAQEVHRDSRGTTLANPDHYRGSPPWRQAGPTWGVVSDRVSAPTPRSQRGVRRARHGSARATGRAKASRARADRSRSV